MNTKINRLQGLEEFFQSFRGRKRWLSFMFVTLIEQILILDVYYNHTKIKIPSLMEYFYKPTNNLC